MNFKCDLKKLFSNFYNKVLLFMVFTRLVNGQCLQDGLLLSDSGLCPYTINVSITLHQNDNYGETQSLPISLETQLEKLYLKFKLINTSKDDADYLIVERCWATTSSDYNSREKGFIINWPGCPYNNYKEVIFLRHNGNSSEVELDFQAFYILRNSPKFYIHCTFGVTSLPPECTTLQQPDYVQSAVIKTIGPFKRVRKLQEEELANTTINNKSKNLRFLTIVVYCLSAVDCLTLLLLVIILARRCYKNNRGSYKLRST